jgi:hypothetical protein
MIGNNGIEIPFEQKAIIAPIASGRSVLAGWDFHILQCAALSRRTPEADIHLPKCFLNLQYPFHNLSEFNISVSINKIDQSVIVTPNL